MAEGNGNAGKLARYAEVGRDETRGRILERTGKPRSYFYRFRNPMLEPFVVLNGVTNGLIEESLLVELQDRANRRDGEDGTLSLGI